MSMSLEPFSVLKSPLQGLDSQRLVASQGDWLEDAWPGAAARYRDFWHAVKNVARLASNEGMQAYIIKKQRAAKGLATIIFDQVVIHPDEGEVTGYDLDYWLPPFTSESDHMATALLLRSACEDLHRQRQLASQGPLTPSETQIPLPPVPVPPATYMATIRAGDINPATGLSIMMHEVGQPAVLSVPTGNDPFGVTKGGAVLQLYSYS